MSVYGEKELKEEQEEFESKKAGFANACRDKVKTRNDCCCENSLERVKECAFAVGCSFVKRTDRSYNPVIQHVRFNVHFF